MFLRNTVFPGVAVNPIWNFWLICGRVVLRAHATCAPIAATRRGTAVDRQKNGLLGVRNSAFGSTKRTFFVAKSEDAKAEDAKAEGLSSRSGKHAGAVSEKENQRTPMRQSGKISNLAAGFSTWELLLMGLGRIFLYILWTLRFLMALFPETLCTKLQRMDGCGIGVERGIFPGSVFTRGALCPVYASSSRMVFGEPSGLFVG
jgi:hypothetical protein